MLLILLIKGNSLLRGPEDVVAQILHKASPTSSHDESSPVVSCNIPQTLAYKIGGQVEYLLASIKSASLTIF